MKGNKVRLLALALSLLLCWITVFSVMAAEETAEFENGASEADMSGGTVEEVNTYGRYIQQFEGMEQPQGAVNAIFVRASDFFHNDGAEIAAEPNDDGAIVWRNEAGKLIWEFEVETPAFYHVSVIYKAVDQKRTDIQINGSVDSVAFNELSLMKLPRVWLDSTDNFASDEKGNDLRPELVQSADWHTGFFESVDGLYDESFRFYLETGKHTVSIEAVSQVFALSGIRLVPYTALKSYKEYMVQNAAVPKYKGATLKCEAEKMAYRTSPSIVALCDMSSPHSTPYSPNKLKLNTTGGSNWKYPGQTIAWTVYATEEGLYRVSIRYRQSFLNGLNVYRILYVNGEIPFREAKCIPFTYNAGWQVSELDGYYIKLKEGENTIALTVTLGNMAQPIRQLQAVLLELNRVYRQIVMVTGTVPDKYRDYALEKEIPGLVHDLSVNEAMLREIAGSLEKESGVSGREVSQMKEFARQLGDIAKKVYTITKNSRLDKLKSNLSALGALTARLREQSLELDSIWFGSDSISTQPGIANFFEEVQHRFKRFLATFVEDYGNMESGKSGRRIRVWIQTQGNAMGRDQMQIIKNMLDDDFTPKTDISVQLQLIQGSVIQAIFAGEGPDIAINCAVSEPVNYAMRDTLYDLSAFGDFKDISQSFVQGSLRPYQYQGKYYALPERQSFNMMFYRKDIFEDLKLNIPETWDQLLKNVLPILKRNNMDAGIGELSGIQSMSSYNIFTTLLYQMGGQLYSEDLSETGLHSIVAFDSFKKAVDFYREYKFPREYDAMNRFRSGEMPLVISSYVFYNNLAIGAPELTGLWDMVCIPGTVQADGSINRAQVLSDTSAILFKNAADPEAGWEFLKWWTGADAQTRFGLDQEAILGASGRYNPANMQALKQLPWNSRQLKQLELQHGECVAVPQLPGSYFTSKAINNAFLSCVLDYKIPREELLYWSDQINIELNRKRKEFSFIPGEGNK